MKWIQENISDSSGYVWNREIVFPNYLEYDNKKHTNVLDPIERIVDRVVFPAHISMDEGLLIKDYLDLWFSCILTVNKQFNIISSRVSLYIDKVNVTGNMNIINSNVSFSKDDTVVKGDLSIENSKVKLQGNVIVEGNLLLDSSEIENIDKFNVKGKVYST